jgi:hypothetical protein
MGFEGRGEGPRVVQNLVQLAAHARQFPSLTALSRQEIQQFTAPGLFKRQMLYRLSYRPHLMTKSDTVRSSRRRTFLIVPHFPMHVPNVLPDSGLAVWKLYCRCGS